MFKLILGLLFGLFTLSFSYAQEREQMQSKARNFNTFEEVKTIDDSELSEYSSMTNHPEYATLPHNAPCTDCFEVLEERTQFSRKFLRSGKNGNEFLIQKGYSPLHYKNGNGDWITYDPRLKKENQKLYSVKNQFYDIQINTNSGEILFQNKNGNFSPIQFHKNLQLEKIDGSGNVVEVIQSNWTNYSAGNDGVKITDLFPNIDFEININGPTIKTNFIVKSNPGYEFRIKEELDHDVLNKVLNSGNKMNVLKLNENGQFAYRFSEIMIYDANSERNQIQGKYAIEGNELIYSWDHNEISNLQYPFIIDPTVTSSNTLPQASIIGSGLNNFGAFTQGCTYNLSVPTPANCTITDIDWTFSYIAQGGASMSEGACKFYYGACVSPATAGFFWFCNSVLGGTCNGANISIFADFATCVPAPQCNPYNMDFTMEFFDAFGGATCDPTFIAAASDWTMTITGETVDEPAPPTSSNGTSLCPGETTVLSATGVYGVPPYTYSWSPTTNLDDPNIQSPTFTAAAPGTYNYTCTITDACGITANNSISITVVNGPWAGTDGTLDICDNAAPVDLTASLGGSPDAGGYWTPALNSGGNTFDPAVDGAGVYTYTVEDAPGPPNCPDATATVTVNIITVSSAGNDGNGTLCNSAGSTLDLNTLLSGADPGGTWAETTGSGQFNTGTGVFNAAGLTAGTYSFTYSFPAVGGCPGDVANFDVVVNDQPAAGNDGNSTLCNSAGSNIDLNTLLSGADPGGTWAETTGSGQFNTGTGVFDASGLTAGTYSFTYTLTGTAPCIDDVADFDIVVSDQPEAGNDGNSTLCNSAGSTLDINTLLSGADPGGTWAETTGSGQFNTGTGVFDASGLTAGTYTFTYTITGTAPCTDDFATFDVVVNDQPDAGNDGNSTICNSVGSNIDLNTLLSGADPGGTWAETTTSGQFTPGTGVFDASSLTAGTYSFTYTLTGTAPCIDDVADFDIVVTAQPEAGNDGNSTLCNSAGSTLDLNTLLSGADAGGTWAETTGSGQFTPGTGVFDASGLTAGTYTFTYSFAASGSCLADFATFDVVVNDQPDAGNDGNSTICNSVGSTIDLNTLLSGADPGGTWAETTGSGQFTPGTGVFDASSLTAGTYSFTYTLTGTAPCIDDVADFDIMVTAQPEAGNDGNSTLCNSAGSTLDLNTLLSGADAGGTWAETTGSGQFTPGTGVFDASGLTAGTYTFTYSFAASGSCLADFATFDVVVNDQPDAGNDGNSTICNSVGSTIDLNTLLSGADPGGTWAETTGSGQFTPGTGVFDASGLATGTYTFTYTITATAPCLDDFATFDVVVTGQPEAGNDGNSTLCNSAGSTLDLNTLLSGADPGGTWAETTGSGQFTPGTGVFDASGLTAGTYTFTYSFAASGSCLADFATFDVVVNDQPDAGLDATSTLCNSAGSTLDLNTLLSGADPGGTWAETTTSGQFTPGTGVFDASGLTAGTYTFTYTLTGTAPCIDDFATFDITVTGTVTAGNDNSTTICSDNGAFDVSTLLDAGATGGGTWTETSGTPSGQFTPGTSSFDPSGLNGTYTFMYTLAASGSCLGDDATMTVIVNPFVDAGADGTADLCNTAGTTLDLNTLLSGADPGGTWAETTTSGQFTPGTGIFDASGLAAGTYTFTYTLTSAAPCGNSVATFDINVGDQPDAGLDGSSALCNSAGSTLDLNTLLNGADPGGTWAETTSSGQFNTGTGVFDASGLTAATYTFTYTLTGNAPCLDDVATFDVSVTGNVTAGADNSATICSDNGAFDVSSLLDATATGGGTWSETSGTPSGQFNTGTASLDPTGLNGVYTFMYTLTASGSCLGDDATMTITVNPAANAGADGNSTICNDPGSTIDLNTLLSGASPGGTWAETSGSGQFTPGTGIFDASGLTAGTYNFTYTITGTAPCVDDVANFVITVTGTPDAGLDGTGTLCNTSGSTINLNTLLSGADPGGTWAETTSSGQFNTGTGVFDASGLAGGVYTFEYTVGGTGSCPSSTATFNITVTAAPPAPTLGGGGTYCENTNASLTATGTGGTISWYTDPGLTNLFQTGSPITFTVPLGTSVFYVVEDNGCQGAVDTISVTGIAGPTLNVPPLVSGCEGDVLTIDATSNSTVLWSTGDTSLSITVTATVDTFVVATVFSSCDTLIDTTFINVFPGFDIDAGPDQTLPLGASTTIEATSTSLINGITWSPSTFLTCPTCVSTDVNATQTVTYLATAVDENGCIATDTVTITIDGEITIYIPNIFSPNNDGENDDFGPYGPNFKTFTMEIYDRWGAMIWSTEEPNVRWDGKHKNGDPCPQAVFVYRIKGEVYTGQIIERSGNVMLTR